MNLAVLIGGMVVLLVAGLVLGAAWWIRSLRMAAMGELLAELDGVPRLLSESANCFGVASRGMRQVRGNGCLALSDRELLFVQWVPRQTVRVPLTAVREVATPRSHLGKTKGSSLLQVHWGAGAEADSVAFQVRDLPKWVGELAEARQAIAVAGGQATATERPPRQPERPAQPEGRGT